MLFFYIFIQIPTFYLPLVLFISMSSIHLCMTRHGRHGQIHPESWDDYVGYDDECCCERRPVNGFEGDGIRLLPSTTGRLEVSVRLDPCEDLVVTLISWPIYQVFEYSFMIESLISSQILKIPSEESRPNYFPNSAYRSDPVFPSFAFTGWREGLETRWQRPLEFCQHKCQTTFRLTIIRVKLTPWISKFMLLLQVISALRLRMLIRHAKRPFDACGNK